MKEGVRIDVREGGVGGLGGGLAEGQMPGAGWG